MKRFTTLKVLFLTILSVPFIASCNKVSEKDIVIYYTTDVHCAVDENIGYAPLMSYVKTEKEKNEYVTLIDAGDAIQGQLIGSLSKGEYIIDIMNELNYDMYVIGNHEFDYGLEELEKRITQFDGDVLSCNISYIGNKVNRLKDVKPYSIVNYGNTKVGYVGVTTPTTLNTSNPANFIEDGKTAYSFAAENLFEVVQNNINECHSKGCKYVVLVTHLGYTANYSPFTSVELINATNGAIAVIDGHSHRKVNCNYYKNKDGIDIPLCTAGYQMNAIGKVVINNNNVQMGLITESTTPDAKVASHIEEINHSIDEIKNKIVASSDLALSIYEQIDENTKVRKARSREVGIGDLIADSYRIVSGSDIGFINGGGIRADLPMGDLSYKNILDVLPYGNKLVTIEASGQKILDYLEFASRKTQSVYMDSDYKAVGEEGAFVQTSGLKYTIDTSIPTPVITTEDGKYVSIEGERRIKDVTVLQNEIYVPIDVSKIYTITSLDFIFINGGDGVTMFQDCTVINPNVRLDNEALIYYLVDVLKGHVKDLYENSNQRITVI